MQNPNLILDILNTQSKNNLKINRIYRYLYNKDFYILAYNNLTNKINEKPDDISNKRIDYIINEIKQEKFKWYKSNRDNILQRHFKFKSLSVNEWRNKIVQEVLRMILSAIYENKFLECSHGYRPNRGCHSALRRIYKKGQACDFFIEGHIKDLFNSIDHDTFLNILKQDIDDGRFIELIRKMLKSNIIENDFMLYNKSFSGIYQGGILSPLLINIYLNEFDNWVENNLIPKWNIKEKHPVRIEYRRLNNKVSYYEKKINICSDKNEKKILIKILKDLRKKRNQIKCDYRRLSYTRYADKFIITFNGTYDEALNIKSELYNYLKEYLNLQLDDKTRIVSSVENKNPVTFLGYNIRAQYGNSYITKGKRALGGVLAFFIPRNVMFNKIKEYTINGKSVCNNKLLNNNIYDIISIYQKELMSLINYYKFVRNPKLLARIKYVMEISLIKTLANKLKISITKVYKKFTSYYRMNNKSYKVIQYINKDKEIHFGGISFSRTDIMN